MTISTDAAEQGAARILRAAAQIRAQARAEQRTRNVSRDLRVRRYNLIVAIGRYRKVFGRGVVDEV